MDMPVASAHTSIRQPVRMCANCRARLVKTKLQRYVVTDNGLQLDVSAKLPGRGAYICSNDCWQQLNKRQFKFKSNPKGGRRV